MKKRNLIGLIVVFIVVVVVAAFIIWQGKQKDNSIINTEVYQNDQYKFKINLPIEMKGNYQVYANPFLYEVGQKDVCSDCGLVQFVLPTKDQSSCAFPGDCGKTIAFVIGIRDVESWNKNHANKYFGCIDESNIVKRTNDYVYTLCPFNVGENERKNTPEDVLPLLTKILPMVKNSFNSLQK